MIIQFFDAKIQHFDLFESRITGYQKESRIFRERHHTTQTQNIGIKKRSASAVLVNQVHIEASYTIISNQERKTRICLFIHPATSKEKHTSEFIHPIRIEY